MAHLGLSFAIFEFAEILETAIRRPEQSFLDANDGVVVHGLSLRILAVSLNPGFQQILIETVPQSSDRHVGCVDRGVSDRPAVGGGGGKRAANTEWPTYSDPIGPS